MYCNRNSKESRLADKIRNLTTVPQEIKQMILGSLNERSKEYTFQQNSITLNYVPKCILYIWSILGPLYLNIMGVLICLSCSTVYHLLNSLSEKAESFLSRLDYAGISLLVMGTSFPVMVYGYGCYPRIQTVLLCLISFLSITAFIVTLLPKANEPRYRWLRGVLFMALGLITSIPISLGALSGYHKKLIS